MPPRNVPPQKRPSGGRPLHHRLMSSDSQQSNISSGSSDVQAVGPSDVDSRRQGRRLSNASTLPLVEQESGKADPFSDSPGFGNWTDRATVRSPDSELGCIPYPTGVKSTVAENTALSSRQRSRPSLPAASQHRPSSPARTDQRKATSPEHESDTFPIRSDITSPLSDKTLSSSLQRSRRPRALTSQPRSTFQAPVDVPAVRSPPEDSYSVRSGMTSPGSDDKAKSSPKVRSRKPLAPESQSRSASPARSETLPPAPPSPSKARWEHLRQIVLPFESPPLIISPPPAATISRPSTPQQTGPPPRPQVPKPSRFGRLGFRHVVEHVRDVAAVDDNRKFADDVLKVCWQARFTEPTKGSKASREPVLDTGASNLYLPFMSNSSLANTTDSSSTLNQLNQRKPDIKRPPSLQSVALTNRQVPTVRYIHAMLLHYATPSAEQPKVASFLPHELQLLSALLTPFTTRAAGTRADEERWFSVESFEIAVKTWKAVTNQVSYSLSAVS